MPKDIYPDLGAALRSAREKAGLTQAELADRLGMSRTSITNIERGRQVVLVHQLLDLAEALGTPAAALLPRPGAGKREDAAEHTFAHLSALAESLAIYHADPVP